MATTPQDASGDFTRTRWSIVQRVGAARPDAARDALAELAVQYWYPVYAYVRRCGHAAEIAQDITQAFFQQVATDCRSDATVLQPGRFRDWLLRRLNAFLAADWREFAGGTSHPGAPTLEEMERRHRDEQASGSSPEQAFQRGFALEVLARGFKALQAEARQTGHLDMYEALEPYLTRDPLPGQYEELGRSLKVRPLALVLALKRLRQRFRELVSHELADTVASAADLVDEQQALLSALGRRPLS